MFKGKNISVINIMNLKFLSNSDNCITVKYNIPNIITDKDLNKI